MVWWNLGVEERSGDREGRGRLAVYWGGRFSVREEVLLALRRNALWLCVGLRLDEGEEVECKEDDRESGCEPQRTE